VTFEVMGRIEEEETIASGRGVKARADLQKIYGRGRWRKHKGIATVRLVNGQLRRVELHWYEAHGIGKRDMKVRSTGLSPTLEQPKTIWCASSTRAATITSLRGSSSRSSSFHNQCVGRSWPFKGPANHALEPTEHLEESVNALRLSPSVRPLPTTVQ